MPLPKDNRLTGEPNDKWNVIADDPPLHGQRLAFSDVDHKFIWIGELGNEHSAAPSLREDVPAHHWSLTADQPYASD